MIECYRAVGIMGNMVLVSFVVDKAIKFELMPKSKFIELLHYDWIWGFRSLQNGLYEASNFHGDFCFGREVSITEIFGMMASLYSMA